MKVALKSPAKKLKFEATTNSDDEEEEDVIKFKSKRKISCIVDSDSDSDYVNENDENESDNSHRVDVEVSKPTSRKNTTKAGNTAPKKKIKLDSDIAKVSLQDKLKSRIDDSQSLSNVMEKDNSDIVDMPIVWRHNTLEFLKPEKIRDADGKRPEDPNYDRTTLYVPTKYLDGLTPVCI